MDTQQSITAPKSKPNPNVAELLGPEAAQGPAVDQLDALLRLLNQHLNKLDLAARHFGPDPDRCGPDVCDEDEGAALIVKEVASKLNEIYIALREWARCAHLPVASDSREARKDDTASRLLAIGPSDDTADRIRGFLTSVRPRKWSGSSAVEAFERARPLIERLALSAKGTDDPTARLSAEQCADVLALFDVMEPVDPARWWNDPEDSPSHVCGFLHVLEAMETSLREMKS